MRSDKKAFAVPRCGRLGRVKQLNPKQSAPRSISCIKNVESFLILSVPVGVDESGKTRTGITLALRCEKRAGHRLLSDFVLDIRVDGDGVSDGVVSGKIFLISFFAFEV